MSHLNLTITFRTRFYAYYFRDKATTTHKVLTACLALYNRSRVDTEVSLGHIVKAGVWYLV